MLKWSVVFVCVGSVPASENRAGAEAAVWFGLGEAREG